MSNNSGKKGSRGGTANPGKLAYIAFYDEDNNELIPFVEEGGGVNKLVVSDVDNRDLLTNVLKELKLMNRYLESMVGEALDE